MFEQTDVQFEVDAKPHASEVLVLAEIKQVARSSGTRSASHPTR